MNKTNTIKSLQNQIYEIKNLQKGTHLSAAHTKWLSDTLYLLEDIFGENSRIYLSFSVLQWTPKGSFIANQFDMESVINQKRTETYMAALETAKGLLESGIEQIKRKGVEDVYEGKDPSAQSSDIVKIISLIDTKLRKLIRKIPEKEKEIQDALENLFIGADLDKEFTREKPTIVYSSKSYIPDFVFNKISTVIETKLCTSTTKEKEIISEINDDIVAYKTEYANLIFVVYDLGMIRDQDKFRNSIEENNEHVVIKVIKH
jgi:hypothetical protein